MKRAAQFLGCLAFFSTAAAMAPPATNRQAIYQSLDTLAELFTIVKRHAPEADNRELVEGAIDGLLDQLDPHSNYYNEDRYRTMREDQQGSFYGVGIIVGYQNERLTVISPLDGAPAAEAGMRSGDVITRIDEVSTKDLDFDEAIRLLRGEKGEPVQIVVAREGADEPLAFTIHRAEIPNENVRASFMLEDNTGYVALRDFGEQAAQETGQAILDLQRQGMTRLIFDLRGNPGGLLPQAIETASLFVPGKKLVVSTQGRLKNANQKFFSEKTSPVAQMPLIVLIDRGSASASEIVAGAIQDHDRGLIVGVNSWGKGLVQSVFPIDDGDKGLALTTSRYYTPSGRNIQGSYDSLEAYYNPESSEGFYFGDTAVDDSARFKTSHGRDVLQTRGITPDVYLAYPETPELRQELETKNAFFNFAAKNLERFGPVHRDWRPDERIMNAFRRNLAEQGVSEEAFEANAPALRERLGYQMLNLVNRKWAWRFLMQHDQHVKASTDLFLKAEELLRVYNGEENLRTDYAEELKQYARLHQPQ